MTFGKRVAGAAALGTAMLIGIVASPPAEASYIVTLSQVGSNVVATGSGSIDLTGLTFNGTEFTDTGILPALALVALGPATGVSVDIYTGLSGPGSFGSGGATLATSGTGAGVGIEGSGPPPAPILVVPAGYLSGSSLASTAIFAGATFSSLGVTPGTYLFTWGSGSDADSFEVLAGTAVPEPGSLALLGTGLLGLGLVGFASRRRRPG